MDKRVFMRVEMRWLWLCAALSCGEYCGVRCRHLSSHWPVVAFAALPVALFGYGLAWRRWCLAAVALLGMAIAMRAFDARVKMVGSFASVEMVQLLDLPVTVEADAIERTLKKDLRHVTFYATAGPLSVKICGEMKGDAPIPRAGEKWRCKGYLNCGRNRPLLKRPILWARGRNSVLERIEGPRRDIKYFLRKLYANVAARLSSSPDDPYADEDADALCRAIFLGDRKSFDERTRRVFADSGTMHVFAISGLHVMVVAKAIAFCSALAFVNVRYNIFIVTPLLWLYVGMIGFPPSAVRAAMMASICTAANLFCRRPNWLVAWSVTFLAVHVVSPLDIVNAGSAFSFTVMLALVAYSRIRQSFSFGKIGASLSVSFVAWAAGVPIAARLFGRIAPGGIFANLLMVPAAMLATVATFASFVFSFVPGRLCLYTRTIAGIILQFMWNFAYLVSEIPFACFDVRKWTLFECFAWYFVVGSCFWLAWRRSDAKRASAI